MGSLITVILPVFLLIGAGYAATRFGGFSQGAVDGLMRFTQNYAFPCLLFNAVAGFDIGEQFRAPLLLSYYAAATISYVLGFLAALLIFRRDLEDCVAIGFCCLFSNTLMLGLPITERAYGTSALEANFAIIAIHAPFCYTVGIASMEAVRARGAGLNPLRVMGQIGRQMIRNPLVIALLLGFAVNLGRVPIPAPVMDAVTMMVAATVPAALFAVGGVLVQYRIEGDLRIVLVIAMITLLIHPALVWVFGGLAALDTAQFRSALITAAVAPGINTYVFASLYDRAKRIAASSVLLTTIGSILTVWFWLSILP
ncbi:malonate transporter, putative [Pseudooceanicola batsensis HTCC2597]|uniref:Malonate transporter, putative n=1 Tax=Pseudooceanicola batsensis (strain ATCC BAA-863 / DSM 15984 / KCTC 12145 / HTCC2597) TaxID=252305 RepID=A3TUH7_PSEBH|nr:AEC family transporter [Pseudooceanicola batsensis]EAQ04173.1 malonate transporter, putative [Pseudooceanicola batsensis HTCC2597]